jgi:hypothetical protein
VAACCTIFLFDFYRRAAPAAYFYAFVALVGTIILAEVACNRLARERFGEDSTIAKLIDFAVMIVSGIVLYLYAFYIYPGT